MEAPIGTRVMTSTPAATTTSYAPAMTPCAAKWAACWLDPHWRSIVVPGTVSGHPAASTALRATLTACSPTCITHPITTSSTIPGSIPVRSTSAFNVSAARSTGCQSLSLPLRRPSGVRMRSTMTALGMQSSLQPVGPVTQTGATWENAAMPRLTIEEVLSAVVGTNAPQQFLKVVSENPDLVVLHSQKG